MNDEPLRAFVGLPLEAADRSRFTTLSQALQTAARGANLRGRWVPVENVHMTLKFLGIIPASAANALVAELPELASRHARFELAPAHLGGFGDARRTRLIALHLRDHPRLTNLAAELDETATRLAGTEREERPFRPHLTLARFQKPVRLEPWIQSVSLDATPFGFERLVLFRSVTAPGGARYTPLAEANLS